MKFYKTMSYLIKYLDVLPIYVLFRKFVSYAYSGPFRYVMAFLWLYFSPREIHFPEESP
jgi:hypothetical protein